VVSRYAIGLGVRLERWRRIAVAAAEQCGRTSVPAIDAPLPLPELVRAPWPGLRLIAWEGERDVPLTALPPSLPPSAEAVVILVDKDTTFAFLLEGERRGHEQHHCGVEDLFVERSVAHAQARSVRVRRAAIHYTLGDERSLPLGAFDVVFMRKDPPFDLSYYFATQVLGLADPAVTLVVNDPRGLREANEKLYALHFPELIPESLVSADPARLKAFMEALGGEMIVKPLDGCGGAGVFHLHRGDRNLNAILELSTLNGT